MSPNKEQCCPGSDEIKVLRVVIADLEGKSSSKTSRMKIRLSDDVIRYKALSKRYGLDRFSSKSVITEDLSFKANTLRQLGSTIASSIIPGDMGPLRSPVRSAFYRAVTPGFGGGRGGSRSGEGRGYRCPEGYQYGGRFTDSRLSTCGQKLFDIPSILGFIIGATDRRRSRVGAARQVSGKPLGAGEIPADLIQRRKPQIPKVSVENSRQAQINIKNVTDQLARYDGVASRMVRRDGFVLEPVVPPSVLRAIPDNRDMEGATFILSIENREDLGKDELGLLSNTGIRRLVYVLPNGSTLQIEKARKLSVGERRKLGRTVNTAIESSNESDVALRLKMVAQETGDGIRYTENIVGNSGLDGAFKKKAKAKQQKVSEDRKITSIDRAIEYLASGGSLSSIAPQILSGVLNRSADIQTRRLRNNQALVSMGGEQYFLYTRPARFQHLGERFAAEVQEQLGLIAPNVMFAGSPSDSRRYMREDVLTALPNGELDTSATLADLSPQDVARMMISDFLTDQRDRPNSSIYAIDTESGKVPVLAQNITSGLTALDEIKISRRMKMRLEDFYGGEFGPNYSEYYKNLKEQQQAVFRNFIEELIERARKFRFAEFKKRMSKDGLSAGERAHIDIIEKLFNNRLETLSNSKSRLAEIFGGE